MGAGAYAELVSGNCLVEPTRHCLPFKEFSVHLLGSSPTLGAAGPDSGWAGCGTYPGSPNAGTQLLPAPSIPDALTRHKLYGSTTAARSLPYYYNSADLAPWRARQVMGPGDPYNNRVSGPAIRQGHAVVQVRRRLKQAGSPNNRNYSGKDAFYFTDSTYSPKIGNQDDWMGFFHPAGYLWTNKGVNEPFLAVDNYEQCGQTPVITDSYNKNFIPFCTPLTVRDSSGTSLGQFVGYTFMVYFGAAFIKYPIPGYKPTDYYSTLPSPPEVTTTYQFFSVDCHVFLAASPASPGSMTSPKIGSIRHWVYNRDSTLWNICDQYMYMLCGAMTSDWKTDITFNHVGGGSEVIRFNHSNWNTYITP